MGREDIIGFEKSVLGKGFIRVVDAMGDEPSIARAARVSYGTGTKTVREDVGLLRYMLRHGHMSPFEQVSITIHVRLPIFVARQWMRHRVFSFNEMSGRYSEMPRDTYTPARDRVAKQSTTNRQGSGEAFSREEADLILSELRAGSDAAFAEYDDLLSSGLSRELARIGLPLSTYTEFYATVNLRGLLDFLRQRTDSHAQEEIRAYGHALESVVQEWVPNVHAAWVDYVQGAHTFSASEMAVLRDVLWPSVFVDLETWKEHMDSTMPKASKRERGAFLRALHVIQ